jgi:uncharacterized protein
MPILSKKRTRYSETFIEKDLEEKMVFVGGPRQVGKTTLALNLLKSKSENHPGYVNWDIISNKQVLLRGEIPGGQDLIVLDEIHKYKNWRNLVKGIYDQHKSKKKFLITGSARLDYYLRGGDSLQGRYHYHRLHPFSLFEISKNPSPSDVQHLLVFGGFPEPFIKGNKRFWKRWMRERSSRVIQEDLIQLEKVKELSQIDLLISTIPSKVGSPLSINNLRQDLSVSFETAERWILILENLYHCFRILPFGPPNIRAAKKEKKVYMYDWSLCLNDGARFENMVASHLLKYCHFIEDTEGDLMELKFLRDSEKREIDFVVLKNNEPQFGVECKSSEKSISKQIAYFSKRTKIPYFYQVHLGKMDYENAELKTRALPFEKFCQILQI